MSGCYLMRCADKGCEARRRTSENPLRDGWPAHCGMSMVFATTFEEERFGREAQELVAQQFVSARAVAKAWQQHVNA